MIVVDSSAWIAYLRDLPTTTVQKLEPLLGSDNILLGDVILLEVLQGARDERHARRIEQDLRLFPIANMLDEAIAVEAARNFRALRARGITIRKTIDLIIGTYCIVAKHELLHDDRDFDPMARLLGLKVL